MSKHTFFFLLWMATLGFLLPKSFAQNSRANQYFQLDAEFGKSFYRGDLTSGSGFVEMNSGTFGMGLGLTKKLNSRLKMRAALSFLRLEASDAELSDTGTFNYNRNLHFRNDILEARFTGSFYFLEEKLHYSQRRRFSPFISAGIGFFRHNPKAKTNTALGNVWVPLQPLGTEGQGRDGFDEKYSLTGWSVPLGLGVDVKLNERFNLSLTSQYRFTTTDYLDDVSGNYAPLSVFADDDLARKMADRSLEPTDVFSGETRQNIPNAAMPAGNARGSQSGNDAYWFTGFRLGYILTNSKSKSQLSKIHQLDILTPADTLVVKKSAAPDFSDRIQVLNLAINSKNHEMSPAYYKNGILYVTNKNDRKHFQRKGRSKYYNFFFSPIHDVNKNELNDPVNIRENEFANFHHYGAARLENSDQIILELYEDTKGGEDRATHKLYLANGFAESVLDSIQPLPFNNSDYSVSQPAQPASGGAVVFASDMEGGLGGTDLYVSYQVNGTWTYPKNLGATINTPGDEMFPYFHVDSTFYFASNGHPGMGGLDLFEVTFGSNETVKEIKNLGSPINSAGDDFGLILDDYKRKGFFTSNRQGGKGGMDIYEADIDLISEERKITKTDGRMIRKIDLQLKGEVWNKGTRKPLNGAIVRLRNIIEDEFKIVRTNKKGEFSFQIENDEIYEIYASSLGFEHMENRIISTVGIDDPYPLESFIDLIPEKHYLHIKGIVRHTDTKDPIEGATITVISLADEQEETFTTDAKGEYKIDLDQGRKYTLNVEKEGFVKKSYPIETRKKRSSETRKYYSEMIPLDKENP